MAEPVSDDRAIEVLASVPITEDYVHIPGGGGWPEERRFRPRDRRVIAAEQVEALASAGFQITDLTPEEAKAYRELANCPADEEEGLSDRLLALATTADAKLRRLSGATDG